MPDTGTEIGLIPSARWWKGFPSKQSYQIGTRITAFVQCINCDSLFQRSIHATKICAITKHKDERSLSLYISETTSARKRGVHRFLSDTFQPKLTGQQEASGIPRQNVAAWSASPSLNLNPQSLVQNHFISLAQPFQNCTQHILIGTMNIHRGKYEEPSPSTC